MGTSRRAAWRATLPGMNPSDQPPLSLRTPADVIAAVPYLLGFHPADSLVVVALRGKRVVFVARGDLPGPATGPAVPSGLASSGPASSGPASSGSGPLPGPDGAGRARDSGSAALGPLGPLGPGAAAGPGIVGPGPGSRDPGSGPVGDLDTLDLDDVARHIAAVVGRQSADTATVIGYGPPERVTPAVDAVRTELARAGLRVLDALRVTGSRYWSYLCDDPHCCPPEGKAFDPSTSRVAAAATFAGQVALPDRAALVRLLDPVVGAAREAMRLATVRADQSLTRLLAAAPTEPRRARELRTAGESAVRVAHDRHRRADRLIDDEVAWLSLLLDHIPVRDHAWRRTGPEDWQQSLWGDLVRRAEPGLVAAPASLLAFSAWRAGQGALAAVAIERALSDRPGYSMALLLEDVLRNGVQPSTVEAWPRVRRPGARRGASGRPPGGEARARADADRSRTRARPSGGEPTRRARRPRRPVR